MLAIVTCLLLLVLENSPAVKTARTEHCQNENFTARCGSDEVVVMVTAVYGRMRLSQCVERDYGYIGCSKSVLADADSMCSGRRECQIPVPNPLFDAAKPCPNDLKSYFLAEYKCTKVITVPEAICRASILVDVTAPSGEFSSYVTDESELGSAKCPWVIKARPGQRINMTLLDFSTRGELDGACQAYAIVREKDPVRSFTICRGLIRERHAYLSQGSTLEVRIVRPKNGRGRHFILKYEMIGCGDPETPHGGWLKRNGNEAKLGCKNSDVTWRLTCERNKWVGTYSNCTTGKTAGVFGDVTWGKHTIPFGSSMIIVVAIALTLGLLILITGLSILKCRKRPVPTAGRFSDHQYQTTYKVAGSVGGRTAPIGVDQESLYQTPENEYAYIADFQPINDIQVQNLSNRHMELYKARKCYDYGTAATQHQHQQEQQQQQQQQQQPPPPPPPPPPPQQQQHAKMAAKARPLPASDRAPSAAKGKPEVQERYVEKAERRPVDVPPTYFELDPDDERPEAGKRERRPRPANCSVGAHGTEENVMRRANQSTHEFTPAAYDQLMDAPGNDNHKSV